MDAEAPRGNHYTRERGCVVIRCSCGNPLVSVEAICERCDSPVSNPAMASFLHTVGYSIEPYRCTCGETSYLLWNYGKQRSSILACSRECAIHMSTRYTDPFQPETNERPLDALVASMPNMVQLPDGRLFPCYNGEVLTWALGSHFTHADELEGYPRTKAQIAALRAHRPDVLEYECRQLVKSALADRLFGHKAEELLNLIDEHSA